MVLLKTHLIIYSKNDKQNSSKSVQSFYKIGIFHKETSVLESLFLTNLQVFNLQPYLSRDSSAVVFL